MNKTPKYVASTTLESPEWNNSTVIEDDVAEAVARLKQEDGKDIAVDGRGTLGRSLMRDHLLDEVRLFLHPVIVGSGRRLFDDESDPVELALLDSHAYDTLVIPVTYKPTGVSDTDSTVREAQKLAPPDVFRRRNDEPRAVALIVPGGCSEAGPRQPSERRRML